MVARVLKVIAHDSIGAPRGALWAATAAARLGSWWRQLRTASADGERPPLRLKARHRRLVEQHLASLPDQDRHERFNGGVDAEFARRYARRIDFGRDLVFGVIRGSQLVGLVHGARFDTGDKRLVEIGVSVLPAHRRQGHATRMLRALLREAPGLGVQRAMLCYRPHNSGMAALSRSVGCRRELRWGEVTAVIDLGP